MRVTKISMVWKWKWKWKWWPSMTTQHQRKNFHRCLTMILTMGKKQRIPFSTSESQSHTRSQAPQQFLKNDLLRRGSTARLRLLGSTPNRLTVRSSKHTWLLARYVAIPTQLISVMIATNKNVLLLRAPHTCLGVTRRAQNPATVQPHQHGTTG